MTAVLKNERLLLTGLKPSVTGLRQYVWLARSHRGMDPFIDVSDDYRHENVTRLLLDPFLRAIQGDITPEDLNRVDHWVQANGWLINAYWSGQVPDSEAARIDSRVRKIS